MFTIVKSKGEPVWTVGSFDSGSWEPESDWSTPAEAAGRTAYLNGGSLQAEILAMMNALEQRLAALEEAVEGIYFRTP